jgi:hypothetical protein
VWITFHVVTFKTKELAFDKGVLSLEVCVAIRYKCSSVKYQTTKQVNGPASLTM